MQKNQENTYNFWNSFCSNTKYLEHGHVHISKCSLFQNKDFDFSFNATELKSVKFSTCPELAEIEEGFCDEATFVEKISSKTLPLMQFYAPLSLYDSIIVFIFFRKPFL